MSPPLHILWQDEHLVAVYKPAGWLVHRTGLDAGETRFVMQTLRDQLGRHVYPVHRLDKGTCGVLVMALHSDAARALSQAFEQHATHKRYLAMVRGWAPAEAEVDHPLRPDDAPPDAPVQDAHTRFRTLAHLSLPESSDPRFATTRASLVQAEPTTGRRHQIRRHLKHLAHPIIGDATHGKGPLNRWWAERLGQQRLWLHAWQLSLPHPVTGEMLELHSGLVLPTMAQDMHQPAGRATTPTTAPTAAPTADWQHLQNQWQWEWLPPARQATATATATATANAGTDSPAQPIPQPTAIAHALLPPLPTQGLFTDETISAANILAAVRSPAIAHKEHTAAGWFGQTDFALCRQHVDADGDARDDSVFITVWKQWDFYLAVDQPERNRGWLGAALATLQGVLKRGRRHPPSPSAPPGMPPTAATKAASAGPLTLLYRPYHQGEPGHWQALLPPDAAGVSGATDAETAKSPGNVQAWQACQQAWHGVLDYVRKGTAQARARYPLWAQLQAEITPARLEALTSGPLFTDHYNDWWDAEKNGFWAGQLWIGARQPCLYEGEPWGRAFKLSWQNGEDGPGDPPDDAHAAYQLDLDEAREGPPQVLVQYTQRQSESRSPIPPCAADHLARLLRLYRQAQAHIESRSAALDSSGAQAAAPALPLLATPPLQPNLPDTDVFGPEGMECSGLWQSRGQDYVRTARARLLATQSPVDGTLPGDDAPAAGQASLPSPFHMADNAPALPEDPRTPWADAVLQLARTVHQQADGELSARFRQRFAFAPDALAAHAYRAGQATGPALLLDGGWDETLDSVPSPGRVLVRTLKAAHGQGQGQGHGQGQGQDGGQGQPQWWLLQGLQAQPLPDLYGAGRSVNRQCFARCDGTHITTHTGWDGPVIARFALPQGNEGIPPSLGLAAGAAGQACDELIPFNNGQRVLLRNSTGVYLLTPDAVQRLHPLQWDEEGPYTWAKNQQAHPDGNRLRLHMVHMALSADEQYIAVGDQDSAHTVLNAQALGLAEVQVLARYAPLSAYPCHATFTHAPAPHESSKLLASACHLYTGSTGVAQLRSLPRLNQPMQQAQVDPALQTIQTQWRVEASAAVAGLVVLGDANGTLHGLDDTGQALWHHHIGGAVAAIDLTPDGSTLIATSHSGYLVVLQRVDTGPDPYAIGNSDYAEVGRWLFWRDEPAPLHW